MLNQYFTYLLYRNFHMILMLFSPIKYRSFKLIFTNLWANKKKGVPQERHSLIINFQICFISRLLQSNWNDSDQREP